LILSPFEWTIAKRYMLPGRGEAVIALVASISIGVVMLSVAMLLVVMSVMNGFRAELIDRIVGLNGHAVVQGYGNRIDNWREVVERTRAIDGVVAASPLIEQPLLVSFNGRVEGVAVRGETPEDIRRLGPDVLLGDISRLQEGQDTVAIGSRLALKLGARVGDVITVINPQGRSTPFGTALRQVRYTIAAIFEIGVYDYDERFVVMPLANAQILMLLGDSVQMIEVTTNDADRAAEMLRPLARELMGQAVVTDWKANNAQLFEALEVERVAMFFALSIIVLVAAFNILSSLVMLVRSKTRDIAIMRTMGATRKSLLKIFVTTGSVIGVVGTVAGLALGFLILQFRQQIVRGIELLTGQSLWDPQIRFLSEMPSRTDPMEVLLICVMSMGLSFLATLYPAYRAAGTDPVQVLRYE
jgi:lipoprotein-releasing system permease protein